MWHDLARLLCLILMSTDTDFINIKDKEKNHIQTWTMGSNREVITGSNSGFFPEAETIILLYVSIISSNKETPSLTAGGGDKSAATKGGYLRSLSPRVFRILKKVC